MSGGESYYIGVDVGSGSARAALVSKSGHVIKQASKPIQIWEPQPDFYEQSSEDIWSACCTVVKDVVNGIAADSVKGVGFDATCSMVVLDAEGKPLTVSPSGNHAQNIIMWMDHRAAVQADRINAMGHEVLEYTGGKISLEMEVPKLLWLKENMEQECWQKAGHFFDLSDFLTWRATGSYNRSLNSTVCKWTYVAKASDEGSFSEDFFKGLGLQDLTDNNWKKIGETVLSPGQPCGSGLTPEAAKDLGLAAGTPIGAGVIDAYAGGLGTLGCKTQIQIIDDAPITSRLAVVCGTSTCHLGSSSLPIFVPGVWGPFYSVMVPGFWANEAGQSATGKLVDHIIQTHVAYPKLLSMSKESGQHITTILNDILAHQSQQAKLPSVAHLTKDLHMWPDFHGNRSPLADSSLRGMLSGLSLSCSVEDLAYLYLAAIQALAYGTRHILSSMADTGHSVQVLYASGGLSKNKLFVQMHADITGLPIVVSHEVESVLIGAAILGACASGEFASVQSAMTAMCSTGDVVMPSQRDSAYHEKKYKVFLKMVQDQKQYAEIMNS